MTSAPMRPSAAEAAEALNRLALNRPELADLIGRLAVVIADEAVRAPRFANALSAAITQAGKQPVPSRSRRRSPGVVDPFQIYAEGGESSLRAQLAALDLEQLRDIVAEHAMDQDRLAMKWKDPQRVIDRIVDRVITRASKGSAFRSTASRIGGSDEPA